MDLIYKLTRITILIFINVILIIIIYLISSYIKEKILPYNISFNKKVVIIILIFIALIFLFIIFYINSSIFRELIYTIVISIILAYVLNPFVNYLEKRKIQRLYGVIIVYLILFSFIVVLSYIIIPNMFKELRILSNDLPKYFNEINAFSNKVYEFYNNNINNLPEEFSMIKENIDANISKVQTLIESILAKLTSALFNIFTKIISLILIPVFTFYFVKDKEYYKKSLIFLIPRKYRDEVVIIFRKINSVLGNFIRGQLIVASFIGIATWIGLLILKIRFSLVIGILAGIFSIIPYFGPIIGIIPALLFALIDKPIKVLWVIILFILIQQFEGDILSPKIVGKSVGLHPVTVMISLIIGGSILGIIGMLLAVPIVATLKIITNSVIDRMSGL